MTNATAKPDTSGMRKPKREYIGMLYCLPYVVVFLFGMIIPMFYALYLSFFKQSLLWRHHVRRFRQLHSCI